MNRRELLACLAAGGCVTAAGLWWPGQKLISIPKGQSLYGPMKPLEMMLTHLGETVYRWTQICTEIDGRWDAPDTVITPTRRITFDNVRVKSPYPVGPRYIDLGLESGGRPMTADQVDELTLQWSPRGIVEAWQ